MGAYIRLQFLKLKRKIGRVINMSEKGIVDNKNKRKESYVYFIQNPITGYIKIGFTNNLSRRIKTFNTANANDLKLIYYVLADRNFESSMHNYFKDDRVNREWFSPTRVLLWIKRDKLTREAKTEYIKL